MDSELSRRPVVMEETPSDTGSEPKWTVLGKKCQKSCLVFLCQIVIIYIVIIACIINLSVQNGESTLWTALLSSCLGYILPSPTLKRPKP